MGTLLPLLPYLKAHKGVLVLGLQSIAASNLLAVRAWAWVKRAVELSSDAWFYETRRHILFILPGGLPAPLHSHLHQNCEWIKKGSTIAGAGSLDSENHFLAPPNGCDGCFLCSGSRTISTTLPLHLTRLLLYPG